ncbi:MAG: biotin--[acetyl-CoA-carboxylase] ligase [Nitrosomonadales bacterium]|nr:biotin--[acetyl-CoA-carboxylase] ligase [Nitrosomonadales bacterium]
MSAATLAPKPLTFALLRLLADGEFHSGERMAAQFGVSRASVHNALSDAAGFGLTLYRVRGRGYRLPEPPQWLEIDKLRAELGDVACRFSVEILDGAASSNSLLTRRAAQGAPSGSVLAVEWQSAGRGRLGRTWHSGLGNALTFSLLWRFDCGLAALSGLSLAAGLAVARALERLGIADARLKWPNDVLGPDRAKLAGILIEAQGDMLGPSAVIIGIGLNLSLPEDVLRQVDQPVTCLSRMGARPERNRLLAVVLRELAEVLDGFAAHGFTPFRAEWERRHAAQDGEVRMLMPDGVSLPGIARGVAADGALRLETANGERQINSGEVSLRMVQ